MKHILIILISILLLSSLVIGEETGVLYLWGNGTKYMGEWKDGKKHGQGTFTYGKGKWEGDKYEGEFKDGYRNGQGTYTWSVGDKYVGKFKGDKPNGQGTYTWSDGRKYEGRFKDGKKHGRGTFTSINGYKYVGAWRRDKPWNVKFYDKNGNIIGKFVNGVKIIEEPVVVVEKKPGVVVKKMPGVAVEKRQTGVLFHRWQNQQWGWFRNGDKKKDLKYVGEIENGGPNGQGTLTSPDGDKFVGQWKDGKSWNGKSYHKNGTFILKVVNGKIVVN